MLFYIIFPILKAFLVLGSIYFFLPQEWFCFEGSVEGRSDDVPGKGNNVNIGSNLHRTIMINEKTGPTGKNSCWGAELRID